ncbi:hypothetical protein L195_g063010, partial [Trifolium pratense]
MLVFPNNWYQRSWFDSGGGSSAVKFRLEKIDVWLVENQVKDV